MRLIKNFHFFFSLSERPIKNNKACPKYGTGLPAIPPELTSAVRTSSHFSRTNMRALLLTQCVLRRQYSEHIGPTRPIIPTFLSSRPQKPIHQVPAHRLSPTGGSLKPWNPTTHSFSSVFLVCHILYHCFFVLSRVF